MVQFFLCHKSENFLITITWRSQICIKKTKNYERQMLSNFFSPILSKSLRIHSWDGVIGSVGHVTMNVINVCLPHAKPNLSSTLWKIPCKVQKHVGKVEQFYRDIHRRLWRTAHHRHLLANCTRELWK